MKKIIILFAALVAISTSIVAQVPQSFNYQAVVRDVSGGLLANAPVTVEVKIIKNGVLTDFCETHNATTNDKGLINLAIGTGTLCTPSTPLSDIDWLSGAYSMDVKITAGGQTVQGESPLRSVPYALQAKKAEELGSLRYSPATGFIGIGTPTPTAPLTIANSSKAIIEIQRGSANGAIEQNTLGGAFRLESTNGTSVIQLRTYGESFFNGGNVGIGTTSPSQKLQVNDGTVLVSHTAPWLQFTETDNGNKNWFMVADGKNFSIRENTTSTQRLVIADGGNVGIGTADPGKAKLVVEGSTGSNLASVTTYHSFSWFAPNDYVNINQTGNRSLSIYASDDIAAKSLHVFSDARIKTIDGISNSQLDLETLKQIQITDYHYKDFIANGTAPQKKVIAQQVAEVYPQAVSKNNTEIIPDIMKNATADADWISLENHPLKKGDRVRLIVGTEQKELDVLEVEANKFRVSEPVEGAVFVYGKEVHDFHTVDYEAIAMLNVSATQELAKIIEQQRAEIAGLKSANSQVMARLEALEAAIGTANATADANQD